LTKNFDPSGIRATAVLLGMADRPSRSDVKAQAVQVYMGRGAWPDCASRWQTVAWNMVTNLIASDEIGGVGAAIWSTS